MASAGGWGDGSVRIWDVTGQKAVAVLREHAAAVRSVSLSPDGEFLASGGYDGTVLLWEVDLPVPGRPVEPMGKQLGTWGEVKRTELLQNFPNPFNPETWIPFTLSELKHVKIRIYTSTGRLVRTLDLGQKPSGAYLNKEKAAYWDGRNESGETVASDVYFYTMEAGASISMRKMVMAQ
jgi:WD40 repeat protein